jgi:hypothetical protein
MAGGPSTSSGRSPSTSSGRSPSTSSGRSPSAVLGMGWEPPLFGSCQADLPRTAEPAPCRRVWSSSVPTMRTHLASLRIVLGRSPSCRRAGNLPAGLVQQRAPIRNAPTSRLFGSCQADPPRAAEPATCRRVWSSSVPPFEMHPPRVSNLTKSPFRLEWSCLYSVVPTSNPSSSFVRHCRCAEGSRVIWPFKDIGIRQGLCQLHANVVLVPLPLAFCV